MSRDILKRFEKSKALIADPDPILILAIKRLSFSIFLLNYERKLISDFYFKFWNLAKKNFPLTYWVFPRSLFLMKFFSLYFLVFFRRNSDERKRRNFEKRGGKKTFLFIFKLCCFDRFYFQKKKNRQTFNWDERGEASFIKWSSWECFPLRKKEKKKKKTNERDKRRTWEWDKKYLYHV